MYRSQKSVSVIDDSLHNFYERWNPETEAAFGNQQSDPPKGVKPVQPQSRGQILVILPNNWTFHSKFDKQNALSALNANMETPVRCS